MDEKQLERDCFPLEDKTERLQYSVCHNEMLSDKCQNHF